VLDPPTGQFTAFAFGVMVSPYGFSEASDTGVCAKVTVNQGTVFSEEPSCPSEGSAVALVYGQATQAGTYTASGTVSFGGCFDDAYGDCTVFGLSVPNMQASVTFNPVACSPPTIDSILVNSGNGPQPISELVVGTSGTISISGACLDNTAQVSIGFDPLSDYAGSSSGVTVTGNGVGTPWGWGGITAQYSVASGTMPETVVLTVSTSSGSATANLDVVAAGPYIDLIEPVTWLPNTSLTSVTISGSGFGTNPGSLAVAAPNGDVSLVSIQLWSDNTIMVNVSTGPNSAGETVTIMVTGGADYVVSTGFQQQSGPGTGRNAAGQAYVAARTCGDTRDGLILEYMIYQSDLQPTCAMFQALTMVVPLTPVLNVPAGSTAVPTSYLNWSWYNWAIISSNLTSGLSSILAQTPPSPFSLGVTSAYRNPAKECFVGKNPCAPPVTSRHVHGDAVDLNTAVPNKPKDNTLWNQMEGIVHSALMGGINYCIEPIDRSGGSSSASTNTHVHVDWRPAGNPNPCPTGWLQ
jgi:hypothetical protein